MRGAKQGLSEGLKLAGVLLNLRSEHIGEQVAAHVSYELPVLSQLLAAALGVAHQVGLDADHRSKVIDKTATATEDVETGEAGSIGVDVNERETHRYFEFGVLVLGDRGHGQQEHEADCNQ